MIAPSHAQRDDYMPQLTGVRTLAAFMVYPHHMPFMHPFAMTDVVPAWLLSFTAELHVGVNLFFVLSGFLIYYRLAASATRRRRGANPMLVEG